MMALSLRSIDVFPITTRTLKVLRVYDASPGMRRIVLGGEELAAHTAANGYPVDAFRSDGFDDHCKILLKHPDAEEVVGPTQADGVLNWPRDDDHMVVRTYTIRRWDPVVGEVDIDFVKHGVGPATTWAYQAQPGDKLQIAGPKMSAPHPEGADWVLIVGDETALPAIDRWLNEWPAGARAQVFIEVAEESHRQDLNVPDGVEVTWLSRDGAEPGTTTLLFDAIKAAPWWDGKVFAWVAGETLTLIPIRRWLRREKELPKQQVEVTGYWRRQEVVLSEDSTGVQDLDATEDEDETFHELSELVPGFALRVAASIDLAEAFESTEQTVSDLSRATGTDALGLTKLLRYLEAIGIVESSGERYRLTTLGSALEHEYIADHLNLNGPAAQREIEAMLSLASAVRTGRPAQQRWFSDPFAVRLQNDSALLSACIDDDAEMAEFAAGSLAASPIFAELSALTITGRGAGAFAKALTRLHENLQVSILATPSEIEVLREVHGESDRVCYFPGSILTGPYRVGHPSDQPAGQVSGHPSDQPATQHTTAVLFTEALTSLADADAIHALKSAREALLPDGHLLVFTELLIPELADEHEYEHDLVEFALNGGGVRTHEEHLSLFTAAGLSQAEQSTIGWGQTLYALRIGQA
ncbi:MAG: siderophore-interacting protein [Ancrocorticia sp.]